MLESVDDDYSLGLEQPLSPTLRNRPLLTRDAKCLVMMVCIEAVLVTVERGFLDLYWDLPTAPTTSSMPSNDHNAWFFSTFIISALFNVIFAVDAVFGENIYALYACLASSFLLALRSVSEFIYRESACSREDLNWICIPGLIEVVTFQIVLMYLGIGRVLGQMGFRYYHVVGADLHLRNLFQTYLKFSTLLRINQQFVLTITVTAIFFSSFWGILVSVLFFVLEVAWEIALVSSIHTEDIHLSKLILKFGWVTGAYILGILWALLHHHLFFNIWMVLKLMTIILVACASRVGLTFFAFNLAYDNLTEFRARVLPALNYLALALPVQLPKQRVPSEHSMSMPTDL